LAYNNPPFWFNERRFYTGLITVREGAFPLIGVFPRLPNLPLSDDPKS